MMIIVKNYQMNYNIKHMQLKLCKINQVVQILEKLKLYKKLKINKIQIQFNIMIVDIDKKNNNLMFMNILQLKWIL